MLSQRVLPFSQDPQYQNNVPGLVVDDVFIVCVASNSFRDMAHFCACKFIVTQHFKAADQGIAVVFGLSDTEIQIGVLGNSCQI